MIEYCPVWTMQGQLFTLRTERKPACGVCFEPAITQGVLADGLRKCEVCGVEGHRITCVVYGEGPLYRCMNCRQTD